MNTVHSINSYLTFMKQNQILLLLCRWLFHSLFLLCAITAYSDFYVSPDGEDQNPGTIQQPFETFERTRDAIRDLKQKELIPKNGITIWLREGDYLRTQPLELTAEDSGTKDAPIEWRAYENERVRILGGVVLTGFQPVTDTAVLTRLDETVRNKVMLCDLHKLGIDDYGALKSRGFGRSTQPAHGELFFNGSPMTLARWPNAGEWEYIKDFPKDAGTDDGHGTTIGALSKGFFFENGRPARWKKSDQIWIHGYWTYDWANSYERIAELDSSTRFIRTAEPYGNYGFHKKQRFYFLNILEELDTPGEWFVDTNTGILYFLLPSEIKAGGALFSLLEQPLLTITNANYVNFRGIVFEAVRGNAIEIKGGESNQIISCLIRNTGNWAVTISGGKNHGIKSCDVFDTGDGGISLVGGDRQTLTPGGHYVENCHFARIGRWTKCYVPAVSMTGVGLRASHNLIHDHPHCAILFWGNDHIIEWNDIHHIALETGDVGAIYTGRDYTFRGNKIRYNYIHETGGVGMGSMGVYMDDCVSGAEVFGNVFYKVHWAMFIGGGRDHRVINNLFVDCDPAIRADGRGLDTKPVWRNMVDQTMRNSLKTMPPDLYRQRYPELKTLDAYYGSPGSDPITGELFKGVPPEGNVITHNVCFGKWLEISWNAKKELFQLDDNYTSENFNGIGNPDNHFQIPNDSPVWKTGFQPIPIGQIGLQLNKDRQSIPN